MYEAKMIIEVTQDGKEISRSEMGESHGSLADLEESFRQKAFYQADKLATNTFEVAKALEAAKEAKDGSPAPKKKKKKAAKKKKTPAEADSG